MPAPFQINSVTIPIAGSTFLDDVSGRMTIDQLISYIKSIGATDVRLIPTLGVVSDPSNNVIEVNPPGYTPTMDKMAAFCAKLTAAGLGIEIAPFIPLDISTIAAGNGSGRINPTDGHAFMTNYRQAMLAWEQLAESVGAERFEVIQDDIQLLTYRPELVPDFLALIADVRANFHGSITTMLYGSGTVFGANGVIAQDGSFNGGSRLSQLNLTDRRIIDALDILGVGIFSDPLTNKLNPTVEELVASYYGNVNGFNVVDFLKRTHEFYNKPIYIADRPFHSFDGSNIDHVQIFGTNPLVADQQEQADLFTAFFRVWSQEHADWMLGVSFQNVNTTPDYTANVPRFADSPFGENFQGKLAEQVISSWFNGQHQGVGVVMNGAAAADTLTGTEKNDTINGLGGNDVLAGGDGNDLLYGGDGDDALYGGLGADLLAGEGGTDRLEGGPGDDRYVVSSGDVVIEVAGQGNDSVMATGDYVLSAVADVESLSILDPVSTNDFNLTGSLGSQRITGNAGNNIINGFGGSDTMVGLAGDDTYLVRGPGDIVIEANGGGIDTVFTTVSYSLGANEIERLSTVVQADTAKIDLIGNYATQLVIGNYGNNVLNGGSGGADILIGLLGDDIYAAGDQSIRIIENPGEGNDTLVVFSDYHIRNGVSIEIFAAQNRAATDPFMLRGNEVAQTVVGNNGNNIIDGRGGADVLVGNGGADVFAFTTALGSGNVDSIVDFASGTDKIGLASDIFTALAGGVTAGSFVLGIAATDGDDRVLYDQASGRLFYDADANGAGAAVQFVQLAAGTVLTAGDFVIVAPVADLPG